MPNTLTYATYLAVMALATAQAEIRQGITNLSVLEQAAIVYENPEFQAEQHKCWEEICDGEPVVKMSEMDYEFEVFMRSFDTEDLKFLEAAIIA